MFYQRQKAAAFYKNRPSDVDLSNLSVIPDAPRASTTHPKNWDWKILELGQVAMRGMKKIISSDDSAFGSAESTIKDSSNDEVYLLLNFFYIIIRTIFCLFNLVSNNVDSLYGTFLYRLVIT